MVLDHEADIIDLLRKVGVKTYYGDASRPDLLHAAGMDEARAFVVAIDDRERAVQVVKHVKQHYPKVTILAREHGERLQELLEVDRMQFHDRSERGWTPPPKDYTDDFEDD